MKCIVKGCTNYNHEGAFRGDLCCPCYGMLLTGTIIPSTAWFAQELKDLYKEGEVTVTTTESGECVLVSRQDGEHRILKIIWEK